MFFDNVVAGKAKIESPGVWLSGEIHDSFIERIENLVLSPGIARINIQNVADYYWMGSDQEYWYVDDFPNVAPPWSLAWYEFSYPPYSLSKEFGRTKLRDYGTLDLKTNKLI